MIHAVNSEYQYSSSLASTVLEGSLHQFFLKEHFPTLTDCHDDKTPTNYYTDLVLNTIDTSK